MARDQIEEQLRQLTQSYLVKLPQALAQISTQWQAFQNDGQDAARETLYRQLHSLAGTSGTLGLADISRRAAVAESLLLEIDNGRQASAEEKAALTQALQALDKAVENAARA